MSASVYVNLDPTDTMLSARQRTIEAPNAIVVLDYDTHGELLGVEVSEAVSVDWNGKTMPLPGGAVVDE